eukprot:TRINITY_DN295_c0_g1_i1.p1 TRINITY_DN295_c0_g1~~TRINITY_DN295_c0_g1_i1.p1  ORF type:complete len:215 (+),score=42.55 TRINITY_DN295_c0_g1_i1:86-730(+)
MSEATYKLHYFNVRARAEVARLLFALANKQYEDVRYALPRFGVTEGKDFTPLKESGILPFGQVPVLEVTKGDKTQVISQSHAIERFLAREFGLYGSSNLEAARIDEINEGAVDLWNSYAQQVFMKPQEEQPEALKKFLAETFPKFAAVYEKFKNENPESHFFVGKSITYADLMVFHVGQGIKAEWKDFPNVHKVTEAVAKTLEKYLSNRPPSNF